MAVAPGGGLQDPSFLTGARVCQEQGDQAAPPHLTPRHTASRARSAFLLLQKEEKGSASTHNRAGAERVDELRPGRTPAELRSPASWGNSNRPGSNRNPAGSPHRCERPARAGAVGPGATSPPESRTWPQPTSPQNRNPGEQPRK